MKFYKALVTADPSSSRPAIMEKLPLFSEKQRTKVKEELPRTKKMSNPVAVICKCDDHRYRFCGFVDEVEFDKQVVELVVFEIKKHKIKKPMIYVSAFNAKSLKKDLKRMLMLKNVKGKVKSFPKTDEWTVTIYVS